MVLKIALVLALAFIAKENASASATDKVVCYYGSWASSRTGNGKLQVEDIDPTLCTHLIYAFVGINADGCVRIIDPNLEITLGNIKRFGDLKKRNKNLKTLAAIGGWNEGSVVFSAVAADPSKRKTLIQSALDLVQKNGLDGFDLDWEYPAQRGGSAADKANFVTLLKEFREEWNKHESLLLTAAVAATPGSVDLSYDVPGLSKYLDLINVMTYDLHGSWDGVTGQNAPLYASTVDAARGTQGLTVEASIKGWIQRGADPQKIVLGLGAYGQTYTLASSANAALGAPTVSGGVAGKYTGQGGMLGYHEIVELVKEGGWKVTWDKEQQVPYAVKGNQWIGYDNPESIAVKVDWAKSQNLAGVMLWSVETDDTKGISGKKFALLQTVADTLNIDHDDDDDDDDDVKPVEQVDPVVEPINNEPVSSGQSEEKPTGELCIKAGYVRDPQDCSVFYYCLPSNGAFTPLKQTCQSGLRFDVNSQTCNWASLVVC